MTPPISKQTVNSFLFDAGVDVATCMVISPDPFYALPALSWVEREFTDSFGVFRPSQMARYADGDSDCDDFAECAAFHAHFLHRHTSGRPDKSALAFGEFYYQSRPGVGHAINCFLYHDEQQSLCLGFYEPQTARVVALTREQVGTAMVVKF